MNFSITNPAGSSIFKYMLAHNFVFKPKKSVNKILKSNFIITRNLHRGLPKLTITPAVSYKNAKINKSLIYKDIKDKAFVYRWINLINNKEYLGSTSRSSAKKRLNTYFDLKTLAEVNMPIYNAILKYGHENFIFEIIEYCQPNETIKREQYYLDNFDFEYNVLANANSLSGYKHTAETLAKLKGRQNLLGYKHSQETIDKLREINLAKFHSEEAKEQMRNAWTKRKVNSGYLDSYNDTIQSKTKKEGKIVVVTNIETNISKEYKSISEAATVLNLTRVTLRKYINNKKIFNMLKAGLVKVQYIITLKNKT